LPQIQRLHQLFAILAKARERRGAIGFETSEVRFVLAPRARSCRPACCSATTPQGADRGVHDRGERRGCEVPDRRRAPAPYRIHDRPPEQKYADLPEFLKSSPRVPPWSKVHPDDFTQLSCKVTERSDAALIESVLRSQSLAVYDPANIGHFGLALRRTRTSPRRSAAIPTCSCTGDQARAQRREAEAFRHSPREMAALALQEFERRAGPMTPPQVDDRRAAWMEQHIGGRFEGTISGVTSLGCSSSWTSPRSTGWSMSPSCRPISTTSIRSARRCRGSARAASSGSATASPSS
jgi:ribonuclease R